MSCHAELMSAWSSPPADERQLAGRLRLILAEEERAAALLDTLTGQVDNKLAQASLRDLADEKRQQIGQIRRLIAILLPEENQLLNIGADKVDKLAAAQR
jgi:tRNA/tmRNA/rRNA uracil-C5-methylase (TrmA/RlmC/RlmD family)